jgi:hypothetical protein
MRRIERNRRSAASRSTSDTGTLSRAKEICGKPNVEARAFDRRLGVA